MFCVWIISAYHSKHCTGKYQDIREDQVDQELTGGAQSTTTSTQDGVHLGKSRGGSSWQTHMASKCGPMCPVGCRMNQGPRSSNNTMRNKYKPTGTKWWHFVKYHVGFGHKTPNAHDYTWDNAACNVTKFTHTHLTYCLYWQFACLLVTTQLQSWSWFYHPMVAE